MFEWNTILIKLNDKLLIFCCCLIDVQIEPLKQENERLIRENNLLHQQMI